MATVRCSTLLLSLLLLPVATLAAEVTFHVAPIEDATEVRFRSKATLETFEGRTHQLSGFVTLDPDDLTVLQGELVCDLASLDTGIGLRNKHMRENVLHTGEHPTATFTLEGSSGGTLAVGRPVQLTVKGQMTLHGRTQPLQARLVATLQSSGVLAFEANFTVTLADYDIARPKMLVMKVAETVDLAVKAQASAGPPPKRTP